MQRAYRQRAMKIGMAVGMAGLLVGACGVRGGLEYPQESRAETATTATAEAGQGKPQGATGKAHRSSILDRLIE